MQIRKILVPTDFSECSTEAFNLAAELAKQLGARLVVLHALDLAPFERARTVGPSFDLPAVLSALERDTERELDAFAGAHPGLVDRRILAHAAPVDAIVEAIESEKPDLVAIGTHGRRGFSRAVFGSVAEKIVRLSPVPVLTVKPKNA